MKREAGTIANILLAIALLLGILTKAPQQDALAQGTSPDPALPGPVYLPILQRGEAPDSQPAQEVIYSALEDGQIDYPTSLLYRAYALYQDDRLPESLRGTSISEDLSLYPEIEAAFSDLSPEMQAQLNGFLVRPDDPASAADRPLPQPTGQAVSSGKLPAASQQALADFECGPVDAKGLSWGSLASSTIPVRVHLMCYGGPLDNGLTVPDAEKTLQILESFWQPMKDFMGIEPLSDQWASDDGGDERIDIYLLHDNETFYRSGPISHLRPYFQGYTRALFPKFRGAASGYIVLPRSELEATGDLLAFRMVAAHEIFHLLQYARNQEFIHRSGGSYWFTEASAEWADWYFVPEGRQRLHELHLPTFQNLPFSLNASGVDGSKAHKHTYSAYLWPFFMHQEVNSFTIRNAWRDIAEVDSWEAADEVLDRWVNFDDNFHKFAVRNLNDSKKFGSAVDSAPYVSFDPIFPDGSMPPKIEDIRNITPGGVVTKDVTLPALKAQYFHYTVATAVQQLQIDLSKLQPDAHFKVDMVAKLRGQGWKLYSLPTAAPETFCPTNPEEDVEEFYLVLSNSGALQNNIISGSFTISDLAKPCTCQDFSKISAFTGKVTYSYSRSGENSKYAIQSNQSATVSFTLPKSSGNDIVVTYIGPLTGTATIDDSFTYKSTGTTEIFKGNGPVVNGPTLLEGSHAAISFRLTTCTYNFSVVTYLEASHGTTSSVGDIGDVRSGNRALLVPFDQLSGNTTFPAHTEDWGLANEGDAYFPGGFGWALFDEGIYGEDQLGFLNIEWTFTPVYSP